MANTAGNASQNGYVFELQDDEAIEFAKVTNGGFSTQFRTNASHVTVGSFTKYRITRDASGAFSVYEYVNNAWALVGDLAQGSNPVTETGHVTSEYTSLDLITGDQIRNFKYYPTVIDPTT